MNINWKVRFQNKAFLTGLISLVVVFIYDLLQLLGIAPVVTQSVVMQVAEGILTILGMVRSRRHSAATRLRGSAFPASGSFSPCA